MRCCTSWHCSDRCRVCYGLVPKPPTLSHEQTALERQLSPDAKILSVTKPLLAHDLQRN